MLNIPNIHAPVAQWIRASVFGTEGRTFESYRVYQAKKASITSLFCLVYLLTNLYSILLMAYYTCINIMQLFIKTGQRNAPLRINQTNDKHGRTEHGFTIVELLVVIVVIAILAAITIVAFNGIQQRARDSQRSADIATIAKALEIYYLDQGGYPAGQCTINCSINGGWSTTADGSWANLKSKLVPNYISALPADPTSTPKGVVSPPMNDVKAYDYSYFSGPYCGTTGYQMYILAYRLESGEVRNSSIGDCPSNPVGLYGNGSSNYRVVR